MTDTATIRAFALGGHATLTLQSTKTGAHYTYNVPRAEDRGGRPPPWFVALLTGPENTSDFSYLGLLTVDPGKPPQRDRYTLRLTAKSKLSSEAPAVLAFRFFVNWCLSMDQVPPQLKVFHVGKCGKCGRPLTVPLSIERGIGPECWGKLGRGATLFSFPLGAVL